MLSVLLPSRGRPESLARAVRSLARGDVEIIVGLDTDDPTAGEAERAVADYPQVRVCRMARKPTPADIFNELQEQALGDWFLPFPDDYTVDQENWCALAEETCGRLPGAHGVAYLWDPMYPHFSTFPIVSRKMVELQGFYMPPFFPFLYGDTWWNEVGVMSGMILPSRASVTITPGTGADHAFRDLRIWSRMFDQTRPLRENLAIRMIQTAVGQDSEFGAYLLATLPERSGACQELQAPNQTDEWCAKWDTQSRRYENPHYLGLKQKAQHFLEEVCRSNSSSSPRPPSITH